MRTDINADGSVNLAWPLSWRGGKPVLVSGFIGVQGRRLDAGSEYHYFRSRYELRKLPGKGSPIRAGVER